MKKNNLKIDFRAQRIMVKRKEVQLTNVKKDLVQEYSIIQTQQLKQLLKKDKLAEIIA